MDCQVGEELVGWLHPEGAGRRSFLRFCPPAHISAFFENRGTRTASLSSPQTSLSKDHLNPVSSTVTRHMESHCSAIPQHLPGPRSAGRPPWPFISLSLEDQNAARVAGPLNLPFTLGNAHTGTWVRRVTPSSGKTILRARNP